MCWRPLYEAGSGQGSHVLLHCTARGCWKRPWGQNHLFFTVILTEIALYIFSVCDQFTCWSDFCYIPSGCGLVMLSRYTKNIFEYFHFCADFMLSRYTKNILEYFHFCADFVGDVGDGVGYLSVHSTTLGQWRWWRHSTSIVAAEELLQTSECWSRWLHWHGRRRQLATDSGQSDGKVRLIDYPELDWMLC